MGVYTTGVSAPFENEVQVPTLTTFPDSEQFRDFAYHCQFTHLDDALKDQLSSQASTKPLLTFRVSKRFCLLQSMLYFLQVIGRQVGTYFEYFIRVNSIFH